MRIIATGTLKAYYEKHPQTETGIKYWIKTVKKTIWEKPSDIIDTFPHARTIGDQRAVFKINNNDYRLIVQINYDRKSVFICFIGTHSEYDNIDANTVWNF